MPETDGPPKKPTAPDTGVDASAPPPGDARADEGEGGPSAAERVDAFRIDLEKGLEEGLRKLQEEAAHLLKRGQHTRVRVRFRGRELATMPLAVLVAGELATFWWAGLLRVLLVNVVGKAFLEIELIDEAETVVSQGKQHLLDGDLDDALAAFRRALEMNPRLPLGHLNLGIALKLKGERDAAQAAFEKAASLDPDGELGREATAQLEKLRPKQKGI